MSFGRLRRTDPRLASMRANAGIPVETGRGPGPVRLEPSQPGALSPEQGAIVGLPGINFPPAGSIPVDVDGDANIAPGASATLVSIQVPDLLRFRMVGIGFGADDETALRFLTWQITFDGVAQTGYTQKNAVIGSIVQLTDIIIVAGSSLTVAVIGTANAAAVLTYRFICRFRGYHWTEKVPH